MPLTGPGAIGQIGELAIEDGDRVSMVGFSFEPTFSAGRVTVGAGGGPAMMIFRSDYVQRLNGCEPSNAASLTTFSS